MKRLLLSPGSSLALAPFFVAVSSSCSSSGVPTAATGGEQGGMSPQVPEGAGQSGGGDHANLGGASGSPPPGLGAVERCQDAALVWKTGRKTNYTSWPEPGSVECIEYNGCMWAGYFAHCSGQRSEEWVAARNIAAAFPDDGLAGHDLCIRSGDRVMVVSAIDTCGDSDCNGCCTTNKGDADALIDLESHTNARWGLADGPIEWADLGSNPSACSK